MIEQLTNIKMNYSYQEMYNKLKLSEIIMRMGATLSGNNWKSSQTEIYLDGVSCRKDPGHR